VHTWEGDGPEFRLDWGGLPWTLRVDDPRPGLRCDAQRIGPLLGLEGLAETGRRGPDALSGATLVGAELRHGRVEATYMPLGWGALRVRAAWAPIPDDGVELEIDVQARTVGQIRGLEVIVLSTLGELPPPGSHRSVHPRDRRAAGLTYDGRESDLDALSTGPPGEPLHPWLAPRAGRPGWTYVEMALPDDVSRRVHEGTLPFTATRHALFGHDLEKGIVLRGRLRAYWLPKDRAYTESERLFDGFRREQPPLKT
jgi:hypothetical protein